MAELPSPDTAALTPVAILISTGDPDVERALISAAERLPLHVWSAAPSEAADRAAEVAPAIVIIQVPSSGPDEAIRRLLDTCRTVTLPPALIAVVYELTNSLAQELLQLGVCAWLIRGDGLQQQAELLLANILTHLSRRHERTRHLQILLEGVQEGVWLCDENQITTWVSERMASMLGYQREEMIGRSVLDFVVPEEREDQEAKVRDRSRGKHDVFVRHLQTRDGAIRSFLISARAVLDEAGNYKGSAALFTDITEYESLNRTLQQHIQLWRTTMSAMPDPVFVIDKDQRIVAANRATERLAGVTEGKLIGQRCCEIVHGTQGPPDWCPFCALNSSGKTHSVRMHEPRFGGWYDVSVTPLPVGANGEQHFLHVARNVNDIVVGQMRLERHIAWLRALVELSGRHFDHERELLRYALDQCVTLNGSEFGFVFLPKGDTVDLKELIWSESVERVCTMQLPPSYSFSQAGVWANAIRTCRPVILNDYPSVPQRHGLPPGHPAILRHLAVPIVEGGKPVLLVGLANKAQPYDDEDVAQVTAFFSEVWQILCRHRAEQELRQLNAQLGERLEEQTAELRRAYENLDSFVSNVSHDLNKRLGQVTMYLSAAKEADDAGPRARQDIQTAYNAAAKLSEMMQGLLRLSRQTRDAVVRASVDLAELARRCFRILQNEDRARNVEFQTQGDLTAYCDKVLAERVLENLIGNAWKFTRDQDPAVIEVGAVERQGRRWFYVRDNGCGFDLAAAEGLFLPFRRFDETGTYEGTGVGLSIVRRIIDAHNGEIQAESQRGAGATFYFHFGNDTPPAA